jgi:CHASE2 domain-containing sensor protein/predicted Ser/Thr protein kinase
MRKFKVTSFRIALISVLLAFILYLLDSNFRFLDKVELKSLDLRYAMRGNLKPSGSVIILDIDEKSLSELGRWPWSRSILAETIDILSDAGVRVIGVDILLNEPEENTERKNLKERLKKKYPDGSGSESDPLYQEILQMEQEESNDEKLAAAMKRADNVVLPIYFGFRGEDAHREKDNSDMSEENIKKSTLTFFGKLEAASKFNLPSGKALYSPLPIFRDSAKSLGHVNAIADSDGVLRWENLVVYYKDHYYPSFSLQIVKDFINLKIEFVRLNFSESIDVGNINIATDESSRMLINYLGGFNTFTYIPFSAVYHKRVNPQELKDKIVLIGASAPGLLDEKIVSTGRMPGVERHANIIENIITGRVLLRSQWMEIFDFALALIACFLLNLCVSRFRPFISILLTIGSFLIFFFLVQFAFSFLDLWIKLVFPLAAMSLTFVLTTFIRIQAEEKKKEEIKTIFEDYELKDIDERIRTLQKVPRESPDYSKACTLLGQALMEKGLFSMAEKAFQKALEGKELSDESKETYYCLGLLHERQNQLDKAKEIYETINTFDRAYKDVTQRIENIEEMKTRSLQSEQASTQPIGAEAFGAIKIEPDIIIESRYRIIKEIGKGGMGKVLLVHDMKLDELIAFKLLMPYIAGEEENIKRFTREIKITRKINHPNVIRVFDIGEWRGNHFITMEYIEGGNLNDWRRENPNNIKGKIELVLQMCAGLSAAHQLGIIHRDIKPENILIARGKEVKIVDFGIARGIGIGTRTIDGNIIGTPEYMSPEQIQGLNVDHRSDIYSLGILLYQLFSDQLPFTAQSIGHLLLKHMNERPIPPQRINQHIPAWLENIILKCLEKDPARRYQNTDDIIKEIRANIVN